MFTSKWNSYLQFKVISQWSFVLEWLEVAIGQRKTCKHLERFIEITKLNKKIV